MYARKWVCDLFLECFHVVYVTDEDLLDAASGRFGVGEGEDGGCAGEVKFSVVSLLLGREVSSFLGPDDAWDAGYEEGLVGGFDAGEEFVWRHAGGPF